MKAPGGSLSNTYILADRVRKECDIHTNREYGYQRWQSQLKRLQRYNSMFPGLFPQILNYGFDQVEGVAYYEMERVRGVTAYEYLTKETNRDAIHFFMNQLIWAMGQLHSEQMPSTRKVAGLYYKEEVERKIYDCQSNIRFWTMLSRRTVPFGFDDVPSLFYELKEFERLLTKLYSEQSENYTHGNMTLENIMYAPDAGVIVFIDPYEENIIDSRLCDYSQILQSCNSNYELYNEKGGDAKPAPGMIYFNEIFNEYLIRLGVNPAVVRLLEISQFVRMLPFKAQTNEKKMFFFYAYASKLFNDFRQQWSGQ